MLRRLRALSVRLMPGSAAARTESCLSLRRQLSIERAESRGNRSAERASQSAAIPATPSTLKCLRDRVLSRHGRDTGGAGVHAGAVDVAAEEHQEEEEGVKEVPRNACPKARRSVGGARYECPAKTSTSRAGKLWRGRGGARSNKARTCVCCQKR